jgi:hypothetical protein
MFFLDSPYKAHIRFISGVAIAAIGVLSHGDLVLAGGGALAGYGLWSAFGGRPRRRGASQPADKLGGQR